MNQSGEDDSVSTEVFDILRHSMYKSQNKLKYLVL